MLLIWKWSNPVLHIIKVCLLFMYTMCTPLTESQIFELDAYIVYNIKRHINLLVVACIRAIRYFCFDIN